MRALATTWVILVAAIMTILGIWTLVNAQWLAAMLMLISSGSLFVAGLMLTGVISDGSYE